MQNETPYWLDEAYSDAINHSDIGLVCRNISLTKSVKSVIFGMFDSNAKFVDYGIVLGIMKLVNNDKV